MESLVHRISLEYRCTNPFQGKRKVANHEDETSCVNFTDLEVDLRGLITSQGYIGSSPFNRVSYQTCGRRIHLCHSDFNLGSSSCHYVAMKIFSACQPQSWQCRWRRRSRWWRWCYHPFCLSWSLSTYDGNLWSPPDGLVGLTAVVLLSLPFPLLS